jgi:YegS/Rv2252/BmrU family lipid kinase
MPKYSKAIIFYNKLSGHIKLFDPLLQIRDHFSKCELLYEIIDVPLPHQEIETLVSESIKQGVDLFIAAGGDGTVSFIGDHLVGKNKPLGILPLGTGNLISKELNIPQRLPDALELITSGNHKTILMDTIRFGDRHFIANISVGIMPKIMQNTHSEDKLRLGFLVYVLNFIKQLLGLELQKFTISFDSQEDSVLATEILISNSRSICVEGLKWSENVLIDDGILNIFVIRAANAFNLLRLIVSIFTKKAEYNPGIKAYQFREYCIVETEQSIPIQADGDCVGETPLEVRVVPKSLNLITGLTQ